MLYMLIQWRYIHIDIYCIYLFHNRRSRSIHSRAGECVFLVIIMWWFLLFSVFAIFSVFFLLLRQSDLSGTPSAAPVLSDKQNIDQTLEQQ